MVRGRRGGGCGHHQRDPRDAENEELRRQLQQLTERLERLETRNHRNDGQTSDEDDNPFHFRAPNEELGEEGRSRHGGQFNDRLNDINMKVDIPEFEGRIRRVAFIDYLNTVERVFDYKEVPDHRKVKIVAIKLTKYASAWWDKMKRERRKKFLPDNYLQEWYLKMYNFLQGTMLVDEYTEEFDLLMVHCGIDEPEEQTIARYLGGLRREIHDAVVLQPYWSYDNIYKLAVKVEKQLKQQNTRAPTGVNNRNPSPREKTFDSGGKGSFNPKVSVKESSSRVEAGSSLSQPFTPKHQPLKCYKCSGIGHRQAECPNKKFINFVEEAVFVEDSIREDATPIYDDYKEKEEEEVPWSDHGEVLVVRRSMNTVRVDSEDWLRHNIFHTRCTSGGKVCNVIIDEGSCENVVSQEMVDKFKLETKKHPTAYKLAWFKKGVEITVDKRCLVSFSIGKMYHDEVWCDVVPMDACHLLLGRPSQFDRRVIHDGYKNTYTFVKDGRKIILGPSKNDQVVELDWKKSTVCLTMTNFMEAIRRESYVYALVVKEQNFGKPIPVDIEPLM
ncbi:hypothetical protein COP2_035599 [Malus domestica]